MQDVMYYHLVPHLDLFVLTTYAYKDFKKSGSTEGGVKSAGKYHQQLKELCYSRW